MEYNRKIGIYFLNDAKQNICRISISEILHYVKKLPGVSWAVDSKSVKLNNLEISKLLNSNVDIVYIIGMHPGFYKNLFTQNVEYKNGATTKIKLISYKDYDIGRNETNKAKNIIENIILENDAEAIDSVKYKSTDTLIIGGGIAGIQAAVEIANSGQKVILVEKSGTIGGHMAMFDKTFPTLDCAACILTPKMVEVGQHENIELLSYSEVKSIRGKQGDFQVKINKKARFVNEATCIGCGSCAAKCPSKVSSEFDNGTSLRKAIYIPFQQAVPNKYLIDKDSCTYIQSNGEKCGVCVKFCPVDNCIDFTEKDKILDYNIGNIIISTGFKVFDAEKIERYLYGKSPNVITSLELERLVNAGGPTGGKITFRSEDKKGNKIFTDKSAKPESLALIHCIGSRDHNNHEYCSKVCCMYSLKLAHLIKEKLPKAEVFEYYIDMRAFGKAYEEFYNRIKNEDIHIIRGKTASVVENGDKLKIRTEDVLNQKIIEQEVDMVVLSVGLEANADSSYIANSLGIDIDENNWFVEKDNLLSQTSSTKAGIFIAGACHGPKDIPDTVAQASAAASEVLKSLSKFKSNSIENQIIEEPSITN